MNRYDVFQLAQELGRLIEGAHDKTLQEVAQQLIACGQKRLAEAGDLDTSNRLVNGTSIPSPLAEPAVVAERESGICPVAGTDSADAVRA